MYTMIISLQGSNRIMRGVQPWRNHDVTRLFSISDHWSDLISAPTGGDWHPLRLPSWLLPLSILLFQNGIYIALKLCSSILSTKCAAIHVYEPRHDKTNKMSVRPAKTQISLGIRPVWSETSLSAWRKLGSLATQWAHSEDSDQTLSCRGSYSSYRFAPYVVMMIMT